MNPKTRARAGALVCAAAGTAFVVGMQSAAAQTAPPAPVGGSTSTGFTPGDPNPYYLGVSQGFTHDSNVYRVPSGPGDTYSSTSVFGGFDQPISRQRLFGKASITLNRYRDQNQLNNTSYDLTAGADLATIDNISGNVNLGLTRNLAAPSASVGVPTSIQNIGETQRVDARARWGGPSLLTVEGSLGYSRLDYSAPEYVSSETRQASTSLGVYYRPGANLRLGVVGRFDRTRTPSALLDPVTGTYQSNTVNGSNLDLMAEYAYSQVLRTNARVSYTRQHNSASTGADFSGLTGSILVAWQLTAKTSLQFDASRDAGFDARPYGGYAAVQTGTGITLTPVTGLYENNRVTNQLGLGLSYAATAKIAAKARLRYSRAQLVSTQATQAAAPADTTDVVKSASLGATYDITRSWNLSCDIGHDARNVSSAISYSYRATSAGCVTRFIWR